MRRLLENADGYKQSCDQEKNWNQSKSQLDFFSFIGHFPIFFKGKKFYCKKEQKATIEAAHAV
jgi:hypothetical protein